MKIGIVGSGLIGRSFAMIFASAGYNVHMYDIVAPNVDHALVLINEQLEKLEKDNILRGNLTAKQQMALIHKAESLEDCVGDADLVQECVFENLQLKIKVFKEIDEICSDNVLLCSSTSCFLPSLISKEMKHRSQMLVAHPVNPPYFVPLVEIVPSEWTEPEVMVKVRGILEKVGQKPVILQKEVEGFIVNRIQYAILNECYRLIEANVISVQDIDSVMADGLGMRYAFMGPWETAHLNAAGMGEYFEKYASGINHVSNTMGPVPLMEGETAKRIEQQMAAQIPLDQLENRRKWRDERLIELSQLKKQAKN